eukprot:1258733-Prymnesium_polylepis.1
MPRGSRRARSLSSFLKLLSTDAKALATARRLDFRLGQTQPQPQTQPPAANAGDAAAAPPTALPMARRKLRGSST